MHECFTTLQNAAQSTGDLLADQYCSVNSVEIKKTAKNLCDAIQPCMDELRQPAIQLKSRLKSFLKTLDHAEDVWNSKRRIAEAPTPEIWENIGTISGRWNRIQQLANELEVEVINQVKRTWLAQFEELKKKFFFDGKVQQYRLGIGWSDKDGFIRELPGKLSSISDNLEQAIKDTLHQLLQELDSNQLEPIQTFFDALDQQSQLELSSKQMHLTGELHEKFNQPNNQLSGAYSTNPSQIFHGVVEEWRSRFGDISLNEVEKFREKVLAKIEERVELVVSDRMAVIGEIVKWKLAFYSDFLEKQKRYQQETPEQRLAEKAWIGQQRQHLKHLLTNLEISLESSQGSSTIHR